MIITIKFTNNFFKVYESLKEVEKIKLDIKLFLLQEQGNFEYSLNNGKYFEYDYNKYKFLLDNKEVIFFCNYANKSNETETDNLVNYYDIFKNNLINNFNYSKKFIKLLFAKYKDIKDDDFFYNINRILQNIIGATNFEKITNINFDKMTKLPTTLKEKQEKIKMEIKTSNINNIATKYKTTPTILKTFLRLKSEMLLKDLIKLCEK
ncbi:MAG: hypothetical protein Ta2D_07730 [Rickettsiales bacterium]|nr:MAG: hypothetical protein Ta2D_07730 [Rickettsiales bacterium]